MKLSDYVLEKTLDRFYEEEEGGLFMGIIVGAVIGEILDHLPYISHYIPDAFGYFIPGAAEKLTGHLDKLGAVAGGIAGVLKG